jgi:uncharacterized membrane protein
MEPLRLRRSFIRAVSTGNHRFLAASFLIVIGAALLRIHHIEERSLWFDEARAAIWSRGTFAGTLSNTRSGNSAPIAHPFILYVVQKNFGDGTLAVRFPSFVASVLVVMVMLGIVRARIGHQTAMLSALMLAVAASQIRYAQEVREYSLSVLFATVFLLRRLFSMVYFYLGLESLVPSGSYTLQTVKLCWRFIMQLWVYSFWELGDCCRCC